MSMQTNLVEEHNNVIDVKVREPIENVVDVKVGAPVGNDINSKVVRLRKLKHQYADHVRNLAKYKDASKDGKTLYALQQGAMYSKFDHVGVPTHDKNGKEVSQSAMRNAQKAIDKQNAVNKEFNEKIQQDPEFYTKLESAAIALETQISQLENNNS